MKRLLVIHPGALGDLLLALPALTRLRAVFSSAEVSLAAAPRIASFFEGAGVIDQGMPVDALDLHECLADAPLSPETRARISVHDGIVSWFGSGETTYRRHLEGLGVRVLVARPTPPSGARIHAARWLVSTLEPWGVHASLPDPSPRLPVNDESVEEARSWYAAGGLSPERIILVHPGSGSPVKCWPADCFAQIVQWIGVALGGSVVLIEGPADADAVSAVLSFLETKPPVARDWSLPRLAAVMAEAALFLGNDSGLTHLAAAVGTPTIALFGPTNPIVWAPLGPRVTVIAGACDPADPWRGVSVERVQSTIHSWWQDGNWSGAAPRAPASASPVERGRLGVP